MSCFYLSVGLLAGHSLVFKEETANSGCWCIWIHAHLKRRRWFPFKDTFFSTATEMWSARQSSFQLNSNLHVIFCFNFVTSPGDTRQTCHLRPAQLKSRPAVSASNPWPGPEHADPVCNIRHSVKSRWTGLLGWVWVFPPLGFACQKPFCADV